MSVFWRLLAFSEKQHLKYLFSFLHDCKGQWGALFEPDGFSEKVLNPGL